MQCLFALSEAQRSRRCGEKHMSETVTGYIDHVIFRNEDNGYTVMVLKLSLIHISEPTRH